MLTKYMNEFVTVLAAAAIFAVGCLTGNKHAKFHAHKDCIEQSATHLKPQHNKIQINWKT